jgi:hypothetical protein
MSKLPSVSPGKGIQFRIVKAIINPTCGKHKKKKVQITFEPQQKGRRQESWAFEPGHEYVGNLMEALLGVKACHPTPSMLKKLEGLNIVANVKHGHANFMNLSNISLKETPILNSDFSVNDSKIGAQGAQEKKGGQSDARQTQLDLL